MFQKLNASENVEVADNLMKLKNFDPERDSGTYTCTGMNVAGSTSIAVQMEVLGMMIIKSLAFCIGDPFILKRH